MSSKKGVSPSPAMTMSKRQTGVPSASCPSGRARRRARSSSGRAARRGSVALAGWPAKNIWVTTREMPSEKSVMVRQGARPGAGPGRMVR
jgi:hypothetical protein